MSYFSLPLALRTRASTTRWSTSWANRLPSQRALYSDRDVRQSRRRWFGVALHQRTSFHPHDRIGLEVRRSARAHGATQYW